MPRKKQVKENLNIIIPREKIFEYKQIFKMLDLNKTGEIITNDFIKMRQIFCYPIDEKNMNNIINKIDTDGKGKLNFNEFIKLIQKQIEYVNQTNEKMLLKSFKQELKNKFLGNKRKRSYTPKDINIQLSKKNHLLNADCADLVDDIFSRKEEESDLGTSFSSNSFYEKFRKDRVENELNKNKLKKVDSIFEEDEKNNIFESISKKSKNDIKILPIKLINKVEQKSNKNIFKVIKDEKESYSRQNSINTFKIGTNIESSSKKVHVNSVYNPAEDSSLSFESNVDSTNTFKNKTKIKINKISKTRRNNINKSFTKENKNIEEKLCINNISCNQENKYSRKDIPNKIILNTCNPINNNNISNLQEDSLFETDVNNVFNFDEQYKENQYNNIFSFGYYEIDEENNNKERQKYTKSTKQKGQKKIEILNTLELHYTKSRRKEKVISNSNEIPYSIIIDKNNLNMNEIIISPEIINISEEDSDCYINIDPYINKKENFKRKSKRNILLYFYRILFA